MSAPQQIYIARRNAYQCIINEALRHPDSETGGILVGRMFDAAGALVLVVVAASGPGQQARLHADSYGPDVAARQRELESWRAEYSAYDVDYVGEWHKHPAGYAHLSPGDTQQVSEILDDAAYILPDGIFTPIVTVERDELRLHSYYYPREMRVPQPVACQIVNGDIRILLDRLHQGHLSSKAQE